MSIREISNRTQKKELRNKKRKIDTISRRQYDSPFKRSDEILNRIMIDNFHANYCIHLSKK